MKISGALKKIYQMSEYSSTKSLSEAAGVDKAFVDRAIAGKYGTANLDKVFEVLMPDVSADDLILALQLIHQIKMNQITRDQIL